MGRKESNKIGGFRKMHKANKLRGTLSKDFSEIERLEIEIGRTIENGNLKVRNVPHMYRGGELFADGEDAVLSGNTVYTLAKIFKYMLSEKLTDVDFIEIQEFI